MTLPLRTKNLALIAALSASTVMFGCGSSSESSSDTKPGSDAGADVSSDVTPEGCQDQDEDGYGTGCALGDDCNDFNAQVNPGEEEICGDAIDNDCNGQTDESCTCTPGTERLCSSTGDPLSLTYEMRCRPGRQGCVNGLWATVCEGEVGPGEETCNGVDDDCDGETDEGLLNSLGKCFGAIPEEDCGPTGEGNGIDDNGDGQVDETCSCLVPDYDPELPRTGQPCYSGPIGTLGVGICEGGTRDCQATGTWGACTGQILPATEVCGDGLDNDCDGFVDEACPWCTIPVDETCDGIDNDCDGVIDNGVLNGCGSCGPVADAEVCDDGLDNDCNGSIDEGCPVCKAECFPGAPEKAGVGACEYGIRSCAGEFWGQCEGAILPSPELCGTDGLGNGIDEDCDGIVDNGCVCVEGQTQFCGDAAGICEYGTRTCENGAWTECVGGVGPETEVCDGLDNNCDGLKDEGLLNACGTCGLSCYELPMDPTDVGTSDQGISVIGATDPDNPTGKDGISLDKGAFIPPYLWAANHTHNTVTKYNTDLEQEQGIFWVGANPSRTAVDLNGNMWVGGRDDGRVTQVLWDSASCPDRNGSGGIETSTGGPATLVNSAATPFADECVNYSDRPVPARYHARGLAAAPDGKMWIGFSDGGIVSIDTANLAVGTFHPGTSGVPVYRPDANGVHQLTGETGAANTVYGMVVDAQGFLYISPADDRTSFSVFDTNTEQWVGRFYGLCGSYGIALDGKGRIWFGSYTGCSGVNMYDPANRKLYAFAIPTGVTATPLGTTGVTLVQGDCKAQQTGSSVYQVTGVAVEPATGDVWASHWQNGYTMRLRVNEANYADSQVTFIGTLRDDAGTLLPGISNTDLRGIGFDVHGGAWTLGLNSDRVFKIDPLTNKRPVAGALATGMSIGVGSHYTYSDFTGSTALSFTAPRGFWSYIFSSQFEEAQIDGIKVDAFAPSETSVGVRIRILDTSNVPISDWLPPESSGSPVFFEYPSGQASHTFDLQSLGGPLVGWNFEVNLRLTTSDPAVRPIVNDVALLWQRP